MNPTTFKNVFPYAVLVFVMLLFSCFETPKKEIKTTYQTDGDWITGYNLNRYNNRPLYINNTNGLVLTNISEEIFLDSYRFIECQNSIIHFK
ncbi:MAG: hypothetical protein Q8T08_16255, partial [Ignavibacteria bacterium]|nr:hypothetical protein [Ignavibacteria bacterium]